MNPPIMHYPHLKELLKLTFGGGGGGGGPYIPIDEFEPPGGPPVEFPPGGPP